MKCFNKITKEDVNNDFLTFGQVKVNEIYLVKSFANVTKGQWFEAVCISKSGSEIKFKPTKDAIFKFPHLLEGGNFKGFTRKAASISTCVKEYK